MAGPHWPYAAQAACHEGGINVNVVAADATMVPVATTVAQAVGM